MIKSTFLLILILLFFSAGSYAQVRSNRETIDSLINTTGQAEVIIKYPGYDQLTAIGRHLSISSVRDDLVTLVLAPGDLDYFISLELPFYITLKEGSKAVVSASSVADAMNWNRYPTYQQYDSIMRSFADDYPLICKLDTIGFTYQGRLVLALKISDNVETDEDEPEVFYTSSMHGDELVGYILMLRLAEELLLGYTPGSLHERLVDSLEIWINPLANPDGTYRSPDLPGTRDTIYSSTRRNANGTDLNRSFPAPVPYESPDNETFNFINFQKERKFLLSVNFHSGAEVVNYPWDTWLSVTHADDSWFENISRAYADTVHLYSEAGYFNDWNDGIVRGAVWYVIDGGRQDYVTWAQHGREVTIELDNTKETPGYELPIFWESHRRSLLRYMENAIFGIHGRTTDLYTGEAVPVMLFIQGYDRDSSQIYSDTLSGTFARMLSPGNYDLLFMAEGYDPVVLEGVEVVDRQQTWLNVKMRKSDTPEVEKMKMWPVPVYSELKVQLPDDYEGESLISIISISGKVVKSMKMVISAKIPIQIDMSALSPGIYICRVRSVKTDREFAATFARQQSEK